MKRLFELTLTALLAVCCTGKVLEPSVGSPGEPFPDDGRIILGDKLDDPYTVENMAKALAAVYPTKASRIPVTATHDYIRFLPRNESEYRALERLGFDLVDHPLDYEIVRDGDWYQDPGIPEGEITWQYAVIPKNVPLPRKIRYEVLDEVCIPDGEETQTKGGDNINWAAVEREAFRLTGNADLLDESLTKAAAGDRPSGRITIVDADRGGEAEGVRGVRVACNTFVKTAHAFTDEDGRYQIPRSFSGKPRYRLVFKNAAGFCLGFNLLLMPASASALGAHEAKGVDVRLDASSDRRIFSRCVVNNAGYDYYKRCGLGSPTLKAPPSNLRLWLFQGLSFSCSTMLQQGVFVDRGEVARLLGSYTILLKIFLPDIFLGLKERQSYADIYGEALHAFAHASHFMVSGLDYWEHYIKYMVTSFITSGFTLYGVGTEEDHGYCEVAEMWANYLQTALWRERYPDAAVPPFGQDQWFHPQILLKLEEAGLDYARIFQVLGSDVCDREMFKKKLTSYYPEYKSAINEAFAIYN